MFGAQLSREALYTWYCRDPSGISIHSRPWQVSACCGVDMAPKEDDEPFVGLSDFLGRHMVPDRKCTLSSGQIFVAYRSYITRKKPGLLISMDFPRFCAYLDHLSSEFGLEKANEKNAQNSTRYYVRFQNLRKIMRPQNKKKQEELIKVRLRNINENICCKLCCGYLINATTITECLHSFCR